MMKTQKDLRVSAAKEKKKPKITAIGGGTGLPAVLRGLKKYDVDLTAIVSVGDDGGSSGNLRREFGILPPGDIRNCIIALMNEQDSRCPIMEQLLNYRFSCGSGLAGHTIGNLILTALTDITGDFRYAVDLMSRYFAVCGQVLPVSNDNIILKAELADGQIISGQHHIAQDYHTVRQIFMQPAEARVLPEVIQAIDEADVLVFGPGSLYTSIIPNLLFTEVQERLAASRALKLLVVNIMTQPGETCGFSAADHLNCLLEYLPPEFHIDYMLVNNSVIPEESKQYYSLQGAEPVQVDQKGLADKCLVVERDLLLESDVLRHDPAKLAAVIMEIIVR